MSNQSKLNRDNLKQAVEHFQRVIKANDINLKTKQGRMIQYAFLQGIIASTMMYGDVLHPAIYVAAIRNDVSELDIDLPADMS